MIESIILGAIQGLTEFLPISSSGHLVLVPYFFQWGRQGIAFDVALHAGTAIALLAFFWKDWLLILKNAFSKTAGGGDYPKDILWKIIAASVPAAIVGLALDKLIMSKIENDHRFVLLVAFNLAFFGWLLWYIDKKAKAGLPPGSLTYKKAFLVGLFQSIALIPGVSRSGITITASRLIGLERSAAARFSFLIATPAIVGAFLLKLPDILSGEVTLSFWLGVIVAAGFGLAAIKLLLVYLRKGNFSIFAWYRLALALLVLAVFLARL